MFDYDKSGKWLIAHHGGAMLRLAGIGDFTSWRALPAEVAQPRRFPDGILEVVRPGSPDPELVGIEIATNADGRVAEQALRSLLLIYSDKGVLPEMVVLVLRERGRVVVPDRIELAHGRGGVTQIAARWRVVKLWEVPAEGLLAAGDVGLVPWVSLARHDGPVEPLLQRCRERIDGSATAGERANLLAVSQVLLRLRQQDADGRLAAIFGGDQAMIESPLIEELETRAALRTHRSLLLSILTDSLGSTPDDVRGMVNSVADQKLLEAWLKASLRSRSWDDVRAWYRDHVILGK